MTRNLPTEPVMTPPARMRARVQEYLALRRSLGFKLAGEQRMLLDFADELDGTGQGTVTVAAALAWACRPETASAAHRARRLGVVRCFARHLQTLDPACEVPAAGLLPAHTVRRPPYIYSPEEIAALVHAAGTISAPLHAATVQTVISLIAGTGLRLGEALGLDRADIDPDTGLLTVAGKNDQVRLVPVHPSTTVMLASYAARRDRLRPVTSSPAFFVSATGRRASSSGIEQAFARLLPQAEISTPPGRRRPRIHDLRHSFAVATLLGWYRDGVDVPAHLPVLSTYLGHASPAATYWYLQATPELLAQAARRLETCEVTR